jgi:hypothetical protein
MKKQFYYFIIIITSIIGVSSCERDDICIDEITPKFIVRFYDFDEQEINKVVTNIEVYNVELDSIYTDNSQTIKTSTDSIAIPLSVSQNTTQYILTIDDENDSRIVDTITLNYTREDVFIGRSCGFKNVFNNIDFENTTNWIKNIEVVTDTITNETSAHVKIFH